MNTDLKNEWNASWRMPTKDEQNAIYRIIKKYTDDKKISVKQDIAKNWIVGSVKLILMKLKAREDARRLRTISDGSFKVADVKLIDSKKYTENEKEICVFRVIFGDDSEEDYVVDSNLFDVTDDSTELLVVNYCGINGIFDLMDIFSLNISIME